MTVRGIFRKKLGERKFRTLPKEWKDHIRRIDSLPRPKKRQTAHA